MPTFFCFTLLIGSIQVKYDFKHFAIKKNIAHKQSVKMCIYWLNAWAALFLVYKYNIFDENIVHVQGLSAVHLNCG